MPNKGLQFSTKTGLGAEDGPPVQLLNQWRQQKSYKAAVQQPQPQPLVKVPQANPWNGLVASLQATQNKPITQADLRKRKEALKKQQETGHVPEAKTQRGSAASLQAAQPKLMTQAEFLKQKAALNKQHEIGQVLKADSMNGLVASVQLPPLKVILQAEDRKQKEAQNKQQETGKVPEADAINGPVAFPPLEVVLLHAGDRKHEEALKKQRQTGHQPKANAWNGLVASLQASQDQPMTQAEFLKQKALKEQDTGQKRRRPKQVTEDGWCGSIGWNNKWDEALKKEASRSQKSAAPAQEQPQDVAVPEAPRAADNRLPVTASKVLTHVKVPRASAATISQQGQAPVSAKQLHAP